MLKNVRKKNFLQVNWQKKGRMKKQEADWKKNRKADWWKKKKKKDRLKRQDMAFFFLKKGRGQFRKDNVDWKGQGPLNKKG